MLANVSNHRAFIWSVLALPSIPMTALLVRGGQGPQGQPIAEMLLHPTGEFAARFMIIAMIITPMRMLLPNSNFWNWMAKRRRYFGVAAFAFALAHTILYIIDIGTLAKLLGEFFELGIWTGWAAFFIFIPLAVTSNDISVRRMGPKGWKTLQRWVYPAAILTLLHWIFIHNNLGPALGHFIPLAALEAYRLWKAMTDRKELGSRL